MPEEIAGMIGLFVNTLCSMAVKDRSPERGMLGAVTVTANRQMPSGHHELKFPRTRFTVLPKVCSKLSNEKLYEKGYLKNYVEGYLNHPLSKKFEAIALPN